MPRVSKEKEDRGGVKNENETQRETQTAITKIVVESYTQAPFGFCKTFTKIEPAVRDIWLVVEAVPEKLELMTNGETEPKITWRMY